jgi:hypothetical protein
VYILFPSEYFVGNMICRSVNSRSEINLGAAGEESIVQDSIFNFFIYDTEDFAIDYASEPFVF